MRLDVRPDALRAAAADLERCAAELQQAVAEFCGTGEHCVAGAGRAAYDAVASAVQQGDHAGRVLVTDLRLLSDALDRLSAAYVALDERLLPPETGP